MNSRAASKSGHKGIYIIHNRKGEPRFRVQICRVTGTGPFGERGSRDGRCRRTFNYGVYTTLEEAKERYIEVVKDWGLEDMTRPAALTPIFGEKVVA
jgi:hypothetical protein